MVSPPGRSIPPIPDSGLRSSLGSAVAALAIWLLMLPMLARFPQSGDGAEIVEVALRGGVLHPTGFPLQAWLDRLFVSLPFAQPATRIALICLIAHGATAFALCEILRLLEVGLAGRLAAAFSFAFFPPVWGLAVEPEVFSLANLLIAGAILQQVRLASRPPGSGSRRETLAVGAMAGLAAAQHPITVVAAPAFLSSAWILLRNPAGRLSRLVIMGAVFALVAGGSYASLPLLRGDSPWPDWGHLASAADIARHAFRVEYGTLSLAVLPGGRTLGGLQVLAWDLLRYWHVASIGVLVGIWALGRRRQLAPSFVAILGVLGLSLLVLLRARTLSTLASLAYLEKLDGPAVLAGALFLGAGVDRLVVSWSPQAARRGWAAAAVVAAFAAVLAVLGWTRADASRDDTLEIFRRALGAQLPAGAVYLSDNDVESFSGASSADGGRRFPIVDGLLERPWYVASVAPRIEPRLSWERLSAVDSDRIAQAALDSGLPVASTARRLVEGARSTPQLRGLFFVSYPSVGATDGRGTADGALALCPFVAELRALPRSGHTISKSIYRDLFARAFEGASAYFEKNGEREAAAAARSVAVELTAARDPSRWRKGCEELARAAAGARVDPGGASR